jgi:hypothetical protein
LSVKQRLELIEKLESGVSVSRVREKYGHSSVSDTPSCPVIPVKSRIYSNKNAVLMACLWEFGLKLRYDSCLIKKEIGISTSAVDLSILLNN